VTRKGVSKTGCLSTQKDFWALFDEELSLVQDFVDSDGKLNKVLDRFCSAG
jgi:hypothetical protein